MSKFTHLHVHSHYSVLDGMSKVPDLVDKAIRCGMYSIALTDHGNMFGIKELTDYSNKINGKVKDKIKAQEEILKGETSSQEEKDAALTEIDRLKQQFFKPIVGVEAYCARRTLYDKDKDVKDINPESGKERIIDRSGYHLILLAKNKKGYQNLCKLVSKSWTDGIYGRPRIDKNILKEYHEGLVVCSACLGGEIPQLIIAGKLDEAEKSINWFKNVFGDDYYIEIQRHRTDKPNAEVRTFERQQQVIPSLLDLAKKTNTKVIATNDVHFVEEEHGEAHDRLICLSTGKDLDDPNRMHYTKQEWLKTPEEMAEIFKDVPESLGNTQEIVDKVETYSIESGPIMPMFDIPKEFGTEEEYRQKYTEEDLFNEFTQNEKGEVVLSREEAESKIKKLGGYNKLYRIKLEADYLSKLAWEGAKKRYGDTLTDEQNERIIFELHIMKTMGFPGYFLIVQDYIRAAREELGVSVGPGRGSAAGSVVAYCLKITDIDPLKYDLLFERFLNPDRISLPDIDVDFDDDGRGEVLRWVTNKYGKERVAHIITYGTMATKSSIKDVGRVQKVPLNVVNEMTSLIPDKFPDSLADSKTKKVPKVNLKNCLKYVDPLKDMLTGNDANVATTLTYAEELEDTIRQIGIHACGVIIGAADLTNFAPLCTVKDKSTNTDVLVTQYDGHVIESVGLIKMDFLGLKTLSIIKEALKNIKLSRGIDLDIDTIPIDDPETYALYCKGQTVGTFQFESAGMQKYLRELQPSVFEDLIAMNALYRPGPMDYIPQFIARKQGREPIVYDIPVMEKYLKDTYGVTVYQEQVMLLSRLLANFTRGESDALRKAMGKKLIAVLDKLKPKFIEGGKKNGHDPKALEKIWADWEKFASYAFNKSHATCYSWVSYQTAYLKAHYPGEFMAANLTRSKDNIADITKFMDECKRMGLNVLVPDVNESYNDFTVNTKGDIRFGLEAMKGMGEAAANAIIEERKKGGPFKDIYDFIERINLASVNRKNIETLVFAGGFDSIIDFDRADFFTVDSKGSTFIEQLMRYGYKIQEERKSAMNSLFGAMASAEIVQKPAPLKNNQWSNLETLNKEREVVGIYLSSHPLDDYKIEIDNFTNCSLSDFHDLKSMQGREFSVAGMVTMAKNLMTKNGKPYGMITVEDYSDSYTFTLFGRDYEQFRTFFYENYSLLIRGNVGPHPYRPGELEVKIKTIRMLPNIMDEMVKSVQITLPIFNITEAVATEIKDYVQNSKGNITLKVKVVDPSEKIAVDMHSRTYRVAMNNNFIDYLQQNNINFRLSEQN